LAVFHRYVIDNLFEDLRDSHESRRRGRGSGS
jgi:hypothetical protein